MNRGSELSAAHLVARFLIMDAHAGPGETGIFLPDEVDTVRPTNIARPCEKFGGDRSRDDAGNPANRYLFFMRNVNK